MSLSLLDYNRYGYARYNPIRFKDPTGHYVCTGSNEEWGEKTCYDVIDAWLDYLYKHGGDEGKSLVEQFIKADAQYTIRIDFLNPSEMNGALAQAVTLFNKINVSINSGINTDNIGIEAAILGHELVHLTRQSSVEQGTARAEKEAYDVSIKLHKNMGLDPFPIFSYIEPLGYSEDDLKKVAEYTGTSEKPNPVNYLNISLARALIVSWESIIGCYGSVCFVPGAQPYQYDPPSE